MNLYYERFKKIVYEFIRRYRMHRIGSESAELAFYFFMSFVPFVSILNSIFVNIGINNAEISGEIINFFPTETHELIKEYMGYIYAKDSFPLISFNSVVSVFSASKFIRSLSVNFDTADEMGIITEKSSIKSFFGYYLMTICSISAVFAVLILEILTQDILMSINGTKGIVYLVIQLKPLFSLMLMCIVITIAYMLLPNKRKSFSYCIIGSSVTTLILMLLSSVFSLYVRHFMNGSVILGGLGSILILLLFIYICGIIILFGCELNHVIHNLKDILR